MKESKTTVLYRLERNTIYKTVIRVLLELGDFPDLWSHKQQSNVLLLILLT